MDYTDIKSELLKMQEVNYREFIKAFISIELSIEEEGLLEKIYDVFMEDDSMELLNEDLKRIIINNE